MATKGDDGQQGGDDALVSSLVAADCVADHRSGGSCVRGVRPERKADGVVDASGETERGVSPDDWSCDNDVWQRATKVSPPRVPAPPAVCERPTWPPLTPPPSPPPPPPVVAAVDAAALPLSTTTAASFDVKPTKSAGWCAMPPPPPTLPALLRADNAAADEPRELNTVATLPAAAAAAPSRHGRVFGERIPDRADGDPACEPGEPPSSDRLFGECMRSLLPVGEGDGDAAAGGSDGDRATRRPLWLLDAPPS